MLLRSGFIHELVIEYGGWTAVGQSKFPFEKNREALDTVTESCAVYHRRWYILAVFSLIAGVQAAAWNTWGPITGSAEDVFGWSDGTIALLENWGPIAYIISFLLFSWLMDVKGNGVFFKRDGRDMRYDCVR